MADTILWGGALFDRARDVVAAQAESPRREAATPETVEITKKQLRDWEFELGILLLDLRQGDRERAIRALESLERDLQDVLRSR
jgi:hypothetical protein